MDVTKKDVPGFDKLKHDDQILKLSGIITTLKSSEEIVMGMLNAQLKQEGFKVLKFISGGAQGRVYKLLDTSNNKFATIKISSDDHSLIDTEIKMIQALHSDKAPGYNGMSKYKRFLLRPFKYLDNIMGQKVFIAPYYEETL